jgi:histidine ammonia-lyase
MASQMTDTPKRATRAASKTATKAARPARKETKTLTNGSKRASTTARQKPLREMTLEELSLRAYKMTYERLHGSKKTKK